MKSGRIVSPLLMVTCLSIPLAGQRADESRKPDTGQMVLQFAGVGQLEGLTPGDRFEGRFVIWSVDGSRASTFGADASLFDAGCVPKFGSGVQCAHLVAVLSGVIGEVFATGAPNFAGHLAVRSAASERVRVYFHAAPNGQLDLDNVASLVGGQLVAVYQLREYVTLDPIVGMFMSRSAMEVVESVPFTIHGVTTDLGKLAPRMTAVAHGRAPQPRTEPQAIDTSKTPFDQKGPGSFILRYAVSGFTLAADARP